jgi:uncharacterized protein YjlB
MAFTLSTTTTARPTKFWPSPAAPRVQFGGENGPLVDVTLGDVVLIPAGVGHKNLGSSRDLLVVGAYPPGQRWDLCRGTPAERPWALENIARVPLPKLDPVYGSAGPLTSQWSINV